MGTELLLVRHGQSSWNAERRWTGQADPGLSPEGEAQAEAAARSELADLGLRAVSSSPLRRASRTAELIAGKLGLPLLPPIPDLRERHAGEWTGLTSTEIDRHYPGMLEAWRAGDTLELPGGEPWAAFADRVIAGVAEAARRAAAGPLLIVAHAGVLRAIGEHLGEAPDGWPNLGGRWLRVSGDTLFAERRHPG